MTEGMIISNVYKRKEGRGSRDGNMEVGKGKWIKEKEIEMYYTQVLVLHKEHKHYVLQICT